MFRLWAKQYNQNNRIIKNDTFEFRQEFDIKLLNAYLQVICNEWKTECPIVLTSHFVGFDNFNSVRFSKNDFIDTVEFDFMTVELIP